jgi:hypothetical protein
MLQPKPIQQPGDPRAELERLRKVKRLRELEAKASGQSPAPQPAQGGGFDMAPSSPQARRDMMAGKPPAPVQAAPGAQYSFTPTPEMAATAPMRAQAQVEAETQRAAGRIPLTTDRGTSYVADPGTQMADMAGQQQEDARKQARLKHMESVSPILGALSGGTVYADEQGNLTPGVYQVGDNVYTGIEQDFAKGVASSPVRVANAAIGAGESIINLPGDTANAVLGKIYERGGGDKPQVPRLDAPRIPLPAELESMTGQLTEGLAQFLFARGAVGKMAPGGNLAANLGKDAIAVGVGFDGSTGRVADMIDPNAIPEGPLRDYANWLRTQPDDSPLVGRLKNLIEDMTFSGPMLAPQPVIRGAQAVGNVLNPQAVPTNAGGAAVQAARTAPAPSAPIPQPTVPQPPRGAAQASPSGAGQQAGAVPPGGPATLQASPTVQPVNPALVKSDAQIIGRLLRAGGVPRNDVDRVLTGLVNAHQGSNGSRLPLAFFAEEYLPTQLPKEVADDVIQKLRGFGRERYGANSPKDPSRSIVRGTVGELRGSQKDYLTNEFEGLLGKETLMNKQGKIARDKQGVAEAVYREEIGRQQRAIDNAQATPEQLAARDDLLLLMGREDFFKEVPAEIKLKAADEGKVLWEYIHQNPLDAAHWMQSELGVLARKGNTIAQSMRMPLVRRLEDAVPGYRGARLEYGDLAGQQAAIEFGDDLYRVAGSKLSTDEKALEFRKLSPAQRTVAKKSIRDKLLNEFRKAKTGDDQAAVITAMQKEGVLDALETVLGPEGKKVADAIRAMVKENERLRAIDLLSGSNTADNLLQVQAAKEAVRSPVNKAIGALGDEGSYLHTAFADVVSVALGLPPVWTAGKLGSKAVGKFGTPSKNKLASATKTLYGMPKPKNALAEMPVAPATQKRAAPPRKAPVPKPPVTQETLDALLAQYDKTPTPAIRNKIIAARKALNAPASPPIKKTTAKPPQAKAAATTTGAAAGFVLAPDVNGDGVVSDGERLGATILGGVGAGGIRKLAEGGGKKVKPPAPKGGAKSSAFEHLQSAVGGKLNVNGGANPYDIGKSATIEFPDATVQLTIRESGDEILVTNIASKNPADLATKAVGTGRSTRVLEAIKGYADQTGKTLAIVGATDSAVGYYNKIPWLQKADYEVQYNGKPSSDKNNFIYKPPPKGGAKPPGAPKTRAPEPDTTGWGPNITERFETADGRTFRVDFEKDGPSGGVQVSFRQSGRDSQYDPTGGNSLASANAILRQVNDVVLKDIATYNRPVYILYGETRAHRDLYAQMARTKKPPAGYRWDGPDKIGNVSLIRESAAPTAPAPKPEQMGMGGPPKPPEPTKKAFAPLPPPKSKAPGVVKNALGRAAVGGALGAMVGGDAQGQTQTAAEMADAQSQMAKIQETIDSLQSVLDIYDKGTPAQIQEAVSRGGEYTEPDGIMGPDTVARVKADRIRIAGEMKTALAELDKSRERIKTLEERQAFEQTRPNTAQQAWRQGAPWIGALIGIFAGGKSRAGAVKEAHIKALEDVLNANKLLTPGPIKKPRTSAERDALKEQPSRINQFWREGGAGDNVPFDTNQKGDWIGRPKAKVATPSSLYPQKTTGLRANDYAWIAAGLGEAGLSTVGVDMAHKEIAAAQAALDQEKSKENYERLERAHDLLGLAEAAQRFGFAFAGYRAIGAWKKPYKTEIPDIKAAEAERVKMLEYLQRLKK